MALPRFFTKRIKLDSTFSRKMTDVTTHWVGSSFKAFAVIGSNSDNFELSLVPDPVNGSIQGIPLRFGYFHNFATIPNNAVFENSIAQSNVYVDVLFSTEDALQTSPVIEDNNVPSKVQVGHATSDLDGFTRQVQFKWDYVNGMTVMQDIDDPTKNNGSGTVNGAGFSGLLFKIPSGYVGYVVGCYLEVKTEIDKVQTFRLAALSDGFTYTTDTIGSANYLGYISNESSASKPAIGEYNVRVVNGGSAGVKGYDRKALKILAGEIPVVGSPAAFSASATKGAYEGILLIRLEPDVG